jgi:serine/threonine-protein kinase HipA
MAMNTTSKRPLAQLSVWIGQTLVGGITELTNDQNLFAFADDYVNNAERPVLSLSLYDETGKLNISPIVKTTRVAPFFSNLLPEGRLREFVAQQAGVKSGRDLPLLRVVGDDLPGAVVVRAEADGPPVEEAEEEIRLLDESQPLRFSLAGVQMKFSAIGSPERGLTIPAEGRGGRWIVKLPGQQYPLIPENEYSMLQLARAVGIKTADAGLIPVGEIDRLPHIFQGSKANALWVKRFDREDNIRIHMEDFNQLYGQYPERKDERYTYSNMARDLAQLAGPEAVQEFVRRIVFSAAIGNADMHLKNWTLLYPDGRTPELSPAYDFVSTIAYLDDNFQMALSITRKEKDVRNINETLLRRFADKALMPAEAVLKPAIEISEKIVLTWKQIQRDLVMDPAAKQRVSERMNAFPLTAMFIK